MSTTDDWSHAEIVRGLKTLTRAVEDMSKRLDEKFLPREVHRLRVEHVDERLDEMGKAITDLQADQERHRREHAKTLSSWVQPIIVGAIVAGITVVLANWLGVAPS